MRRMPRLAIIAASIVLVATSATPVAAIEPPPASIEIHIDVEGYVTPDIGGFTVGVWCSAWGNAPQYFWIEGWQAPLMSEPIELPPDSTCDVVDFGGGGPGDLGEWTYWLDSPEGQFTVPAGPPTVVAIQAERVYNWNEPQPDGSTWLGLEAFTVDRVYLNRYGGVTAEGSILCSGLAELYGIQPGLGQSPALGVDWLATQYVGRRTAIHGSYGSDIANFCYDAYHPDAPQPWRSMHPGAGGAAVTAWVYGEDGKFAAGTIRIDAVVEDVSLFVLQWWDPQGDSYAPDRCGPEDSYELFDANLDGFCATEVSVGLRTTANLKTIRVR